MAEYQHTIYSNKSAYIDSANPNLNYSTGELTPLGANGSNVASFENFVLPEAARGQRIKSLYAYLYAKITAGDSENEAHISAGAPASQWQENLITYANAPASKHWGSGFGVKGSTFSWIQLAPSGLLYHATNEELLTYGAKFECSDGRGSYYNCRSQYKPYLALICEDVLPTVKNAYPQSGFIDNTGNPEFGLALSYNSNDVIGELYIAEVEFRHRNATSGAYQTITIIPASLTWTSMKYRPDKSIFPASGTFQWQARIKTTAGIWSDFTPWYALTTTDDVMHATPFLPVNTYVDGSKEVFFDWKYSITTGTVPTKAEFQVSTTNGASWEDLGSVDGYYMLKADANTIPSGSILWRVRAYNTDNIAGPWSDGVNIIVKSSPLTPSIISVSGTPILTVHWQASDQQAYQVTAGNYDSGAVFGTNKSFQIPEFLQDGITEVKVRVQNNLGLWSQWAAASTEVVNAPGPAIELQHTAKSFGIWLKWETAGTYSSYIIYRDGEQIADAAQNQYIDYLCNGKHTYQIRGISGEYYTLSNSVTEILKPSFSAIAEVGVFDWIPLKFKRGSKPTRNTSVKPSIMYSNYSGRSLPVAEISEFVSKIHNYEYTFKIDEIGLRDKVFGMCGKLVVYKDSSGDIAVGILDAVGAKKDNAIDVNFSIVEVDSVGA